MSLKSALAINRDSRRVIVGLTVANVLLVAMVLFQMYLASQQETVVRMLPPIPTHEELVVGDRTFDEAYAENWGLWLATMIGNMTPESVDTIIHMISRVMTPEVYERVRPSLLESASNMKLQGFKLRFLPSWIEYKPGNGITYVTGRLTEIPVRGEPTTEEFTYEIKINLRYGIPRITHFRSYAGEPDLDA